MMPNFSDRESLLLKKAKKGVRINNASLIETKQKGEHKDEEEDKEETKVCGVIVLTTFVVVFVLMIMCAFFGCFAEGVSERQRKVDGTFLSLFARGCFLCQC